MKQVNYTEAQVDALRSGYSGQDNKAEVEALAAQTGKSPASVRSKLISLGLYKTVEAESKTDKVTKRDLVEKIATKVELGDLDKDGLEKSTKAALNKILAKLVS